MADGIRAAFVERFGEDNAAAIRNAAVGHMHGAEVRSSFRWALAVAITYECLTRFREAHGITCDPGEVRAWVREHTDLELPEPTEASS